MATSEGSSPTPSPFGRLERLQATTAWSNEATGFTPWLATNLQQLGEELGLALTLKAREHPIGRYNLDLLLEDTNQRVVIVENQFGQTDHQHLGQLMTYYAGTKANVVIWIAEKFTEEHVAALEWLNENTIAGVGFFGVELEVLRIEQSRLAPHFRVVVKPNEWSKRVRPEPPELVEWNWETYDSVLHTPAHKLEISRKLVGRIEETLTQRDLHLTLAFRKGYMAFQRGGGYNVIVIDFTGYRDVRFSIKLPGPPEDAGIANPYPDLPTRWLEQWKEWGWMIANPADVPEVGPAIDLAQKYTPSLVVASAGA